MRTTVAVPHATAPGEGRLTLLDRVSALLRECRLPFAVIGAAS